MALWTHGTVFTILAGLIGSSTLMPIKYVRAWKWEQTWLLYSLFAYFVFPWLCAALTIPHLLSLYRETNIIQIILVAGFGLGWGISVVLYGLALDMVGLALTAGIILGSSVTVGSIVPLLFLDPAKALTPAGIEVMIADAVMVIGVALCAIAGNLRGNSTQMRLGTDHMPKGIALCFVAGILTPLLNFALAFGNGITANARHLGAAQMHAANGVWALALTAGAIPSLGLCLEKLTNKPTQAIFVWRPVWRNATLCLVMGVFFIISTVVYGASALMLGRLGPAIGWPIYISSLIIGNNFWGWYTGEWNGSVRRAVRTMQIGIIVQVVAIGLLGVTKLH